MTYEEYEAKVKEIVANPDTLADASISLLEEIKKDTEILNSVHTQHEAAQKKIKELQDTNYKLFLRVTGDPGTPDEDNEDTQPFTNSIASIFEKEE